MFKHPFLLLALLCSLHSKAQNVTKLTITDNLASSSKFGYGKPKPAAPKDHFQILPEKGTQVLFFADLLASDSLPETYQLKFTAYKINGSTEVWVDDRVMNVKKTSSSTLTAINFFEEGNYRINITDNSDPKKVYASGTFVITR